jgi:hypothetical protein
MQSRLDVKQNGQAALRAGAQDMTKALVGRVLSEQHEEDAFLAPQFAYESHGSGELTEREAIADAGWKRVMSGGRGRRGFQQLGESFSLGQAGGGPRVEQPVMLAGANGSCNLGQQTRLSKDGAGRRRPGQKPEVGLHNLESLNGGVQVTQNPIRDQRGFILWRMNLGMLDDRELVLEVCHASTGHGNSTLRLDGRQGIQFCFHRWARFSTGVVEIG